MHGYAEDCLTSKCSDGHCERWMDGRIMSMASPSSGRTRHAHGFTAGFMGRLGALEERLRGSQSVRVKRTKPEPRTCPQCGVVVGLSQQSLLVHLRTKHTAAAPEA